MGTLRYRKEYSIGGEMTDSINQYGGEGTAEFADLAIQAYLTSNNPERIPYEKK